MKTLLTMMLAVGLDCAVVFGQTPASSVTTGKAKPRATEPGDIGASGGTDARAPDSDARRVNVTVTDSKIEMQTELEPGKTAFVVKNNGNTTQSFEVRGGGMDQKFVTPAAPGETKVLQAVLKSGIIYTIYAIKTQGDKPTKEITLRVK